MNFKCSCCGEKLKKPGALLFSPPDKFDLDCSGNLCIKFHICINCFEDIKLGYITNSHNDE